MTRDHETGARAHGSTAGRPLRVAIAGFGVVGSAVARILTDGDGAGEGLFRLTHILNRRIARKRVDWIPQDVVWTENIDDVLSAEVDVFIELLGGLSPAGEWVRRALAGGCSVVTANKELIATDGEALFTLAREHRQHLAFGASVAGGVPVLSGLQEGLAGDRLLRISGILNGTCNYILSRIEKDRASFAEALAEAQAAGFAEADPANDVDGYDARFKLAILCRTALAAQVAPAQIACRSIRPVSAIDFQYARELGCTIRQISYASLAQNALEVSVQPMLVSRALPHASVAGPQNLVVSRGVHGGDTTFSGNGAGGGPTAVAVVSDLVAIARFGYVTAEALKPQLRCVPISSDLVAPHYTRFLVRDRPGILAAITNAFAGHAMNVDSVLQLPGHSKASLPFAITLEPCSQRTLERALMELQPLDFFTEPPLCMPILVPSS